MATATATIEVEDTVQIDGMGRRYVVDGFLAQGKVSVSASWSTGRNSRRTVVKDVAADRLVLVRKGNRELDDANAVLRRAGLPIIEPRN